MALNTRPWGGPVFTLHRESNIAISQSNITWFYSVSCCRALPGPNSFNPHILPKGPYLPCVSMAGRALLAGYDMSKIRACINFLKGLTQGWPRHIETVLYQLQEHTGACWSPPCRDRSFIGWVFPLGFSRWWPGLTNAKLVCPWWSESATSLDWVPELDTDNALSESTLLARRTRPLWK